MVEKILPSGLWPQVFAPLQNFGARLRDWFAPASEAASGADVYEITLELPGVAEKDIEVLLDGDVLTVRGEKKASREESGEGWYFSERQYGSFARSFHLPADADPKAVTAKLKDGVLTLRIGREKQASAGAARKIAITGA